MSIYDEVYAAAYNDELEKVAKAKRKVKGGLDILGRIKGYGAKALDAGRNPAVYIPAATGVAGAGLGAGLDSDNRIRGALIGGGLGTAAGVGGTHLYRKGAKAGRVLGEEAGAARAREIAKGLPEAYREQLADVGGRGVSPAGYFHALHTMA